MAAAACLQHQAGVRILRNAVSDSQRRAHLADTCKVVIRSADAMRLVDAICPRGENGHGADVILSRMQIIIRQPLHLTNYVSDYVSCPAVKQLRRTSRIVVMICSLTRRYVALHIAAAAGCCFVI